MDRWCWMFEYALSPSLVDSTPLNKTGLWISLPLIGCNSGWQSLPSCIVMELSLASSVWHPYRQHSVHCSRTSLIVSCLFCGIIGLGRVLTTNLSQINLCQLLFRATLKVRLGLCLSLHLEWTILTAPNECTFQKIHSFSVGGAHSQVEASITSPTYPSYVAKQLMALFHTRPLLSSIRH